MNLPALIKIFLIVAFVVTLFNSGCSNNSVTVNHRAEDVVSGNLGNAVNMGNVKIKSIDFMTLWWRSGDPERGIDTSNPPPKDNYIRFTEWRFDGDGISPAPHEIDIVAKVVNDGAKEIPVNVRITLEARYADLEQIVSNSGNLDSEKANKLPWLNERMLKAEAWTAEPGSSEYVLRQLDMKNILNEENKGVPICGIRVIVALSDSSGKVFATNEAILDIIMGL